MTIKKYTPLSLFMLALAAICLLTSMISAYLGWGGRHIDRALIGLGGTIMLAALGTARDIKYEVNSNDLRLSSMLKQNIRFLAGAAAVCLLTTMFCIVTLPHLELTPTTKTIVFGGDFVLTLMSLAAIVFFVHRRSVLIRKYGMLR